MWCSDTMDKSFLFQEGCSPLSHAVYINLFSCLIFSMHLCLEKHTDLIQLVCLHVLGHKCNTRPKKTVLGHVAPHLEWYLLWWLCTSAWKSYFTQGKVEKQSTTNDHYLSFLYLKPIPTLKVTGLPLITMYILFHTDAVISNLKVWILETRILEY